jgi:hypothetical protein
MKKYQVFVLALVIGLVPFTSAFSQIGLGAVTWQVSGGLGDTNDFIDDISYLGFGLEGRSYIAKHWTIGLEFAWQVWDKQTDGSVEIPGGGGHVSGKQFRYINAFPLLLNLHLYAGDIHDFRIYLGAGVGAYYIMRRLQIGLANLEDKDWFFGGGPEFGFLIPMDEMYFIAAGRVNYAVRNLDDTEDANIWWSAKIGIAYDRW